MICSINEEKFELVSADEPFVYNFVPNTPQPNYRQGDVLKLEKLNLRFIDRTYRISSEIWLDTLASILNQNRNTKELNIVLGIGLSGIGAAKLLEANGKNVLILEKISKCNKCNYCYKLQNNSQLH